jgi:hypothetical protein
MDENHRRLNRLDFREFLEICADTGLLDEETAKRVTNFARALGGVGSLPHVVGSGLESEEDFREALLAVYPEEMTFSNYVTTDENFYPCEIARTVALVPRIWKSISPVMIHASTGQGKTHLLTAIANSTSRRAALVNTVDLQIEYQHCTTAGMERQLRNWLTSHELLLLDDIQFSQGDLAFQRFLLSVLNRMPRNRHGVVTASDESPSRLLDLDEAFFSRLTSGLVIELHIVDRRGRREILDNFFRYAGLKPPSEEIIDFIAEKFSMNVRQLKAAGRMVLARMLGPNHDVTLSTVKEHLSFLSGAASTERGLKASMTDVDRKRVRDGGKEAQPGEAEAPDSAAMEGSGAPSPYIVVDVDEEEEPASRPSSTEDEDEEAAGSADSEVSTRYRKMVESADTVERQIGALKLALKDRIEQLRSKEKSPTEIGKLEVALGYLEQGKLEAAMLALKAERQ